MDLLGQGFDFSGSQDDDFLELSDFFLESGDKSGGDTELGEFNVQFLDQLVSFVEQTSELFDLLSQVGNLVLENGDLLVLILEFSDASTELSDFIFVRSDLSAHEFDLLSEVNEFLFEQLLVTERHFEVTVTLGSLDSLVVQTVLEVEELLLEAGVFLFKVSDSGFELLDADDEQIVVSAALLEVFDFLESKGVGLVQLFKITL